VIRREKTVVTMKLDAEDYENIYLRVRGKLWGQAFALAALLGISVGGAGWIFVERAAKKSIDAYVQTELFKTAVLSAALGRIEGLEQKANDLSKSVARQEKLVGNLANLPLSAGPEGLSVMDAAGNKFFLEVGEVKAGGSVKFKNVFSRPPLVLMVPVEDRFGRPLGPSLQRTEKDAAVTPMAGVTEEGFTAGHVGAVYRPGRFRWIAIGG
jgi:hypothetical protein